MREWFEYLAVWWMVKVFGTLPRRVSRVLGAAVGAIAYGVLPRLRKVGLRNLQLAYPEMPANERVRLLRGEYRNLGWLLAEFCLMAGYSQEGTKPFIRTEGLDHYLQARDRGRGVFVVTGHLGAWELSSFYHSLMGHPMSMVIRRLDNARVDRFVNRIRCLHGNHVLHKDDFARGLLKAMRGGKTVGILMDTNMTPPQGVFVDFFGHSACTAAGLARIALQTGAAVLPGFMIWERSERKYVLRFGPEMLLQNTGDNEADVLANTQLCTSVLETYIRQYPDQWLWVHRRWKTRPLGEAPLYP